VARARTITIPVSRKSIAATSSASPSPGVLDTHEEGGLSPSPSSLTACSTESRLRKKYSLWMRRLANCCGVRLRIRSNTTRFAVSHWGRWQGQARPRWRDEPSSTPWTPPLANRFSPLGTPAASTSAKSRPRARQRSIRRSHQPRHCLQRLVSSVAAIPRGSPSASRRLRAYDVRSGKLRWSFHTIPRPAKFGYDTWPKDAWKTSGAANNWAGMALDSQRGILYAPTAPPLLISTAPNRLGARSLANSLPP